MIKVHVHKTGLVLGGLFGIAHAAWAVAVLVGIAEPFLNWIFGLHFLNFPFTVDPFSFWNAAMLVVVTFIVGYVLGCVFGWLWNMACRAPSEAQQ